MPAIRKISPCLWFDSQGEEAANFYVSVFRNSKILKVSRYTDAGKEIHGRPAGSVMTVLFELEGQTFTALNGGPMFKFNEAVSLQVDCADQAEVDYYWDKLSAGGDPGAQQCGWLKDRFGLSWQIVPNILVDLVGDDSPAAQRTLAALLEMQKLDIAQLKKAHQG
ncbi:VOC family protein [uncultured Ramlibacter sp.]|uniref:VOC family protein n=1 Tax=uncultured Ramlibacter sp. TaxID=260755 RepID=UPI00261FF280|nr:VOC family protein [uncultured Ramlibacter sp.]